MDNSLNNIAATPAEKLEGDLSVLEKVGNASDLTKEEREKGEEEIRKIADDMASGKMTPDQYKKNEDILVKLAQKNFPAATEALSKIEAEAKKEASEKKAFEKDTSMSDSVAVVTQAAEKSALEKTVSDLSNYGEGPKQDENGVSSREIPQRSAGGRTVNIEQKTSLEEFMDKRYPKRENTQSNANKYRPIKTAQYGG